MILGAIAMCSVTGFVLGAQCRLLLLAVVSVLIAVALPLIALMSDPAPEAALVSGRLGTLGLIGLLLVVLQGFFLAGAVLRVSVPVTRSAGSTLARPPASRASGS